MEGLAGKRVLVTGADGFIGSHLVERLLDEGAEVRALCVYNSNGSFGWLDDQHLRGPTTIERRLGDIRDARLIRELVSGVDIVFHLAALIAIPYSYEAPASYVETNVLGTMNVLDAARDCDDVRVVNTSTSEVYGTPESVPIDVGHRLHAQSPYAATKIAADQLCQSYACAFGLDVVTLRPFNTFGPRQSTRAVIPAILRQLLAGHDRIKLGNLAPRRDFTYVSDTVDGFIRLAVADVPTGTVVQLGTGHAVSIGELFDHCAEIVGSTATAVIDPVRMRPDASEVTVLLSDPQQADTVLGWRPKVSLTEGITRTATWLATRSDQHLRGHAIGPLAPDEKRFIG
ncbi:NAD-dependent 4,6-dehydratase LegB [Kribbella jejuensis]|uniref:GDP-mannose 4,6-dehydratase n=1 Tax=Kribbella jejuensis TaxID=236068 RepID=UPI00192D8D5D|nr:GDP-mannose 4,6-dehydratase [Kribbella jejuensis]